MFEFKPTEPLNENFEMFGISDKNFIMNSGSFFLFAISIVLYQAFKLVFHAIAVFFSRFRLCRLMGMKLYDTKKMQGLRYGLLKLLMESYFDIMLCALLGVFAYKSDVGAKETILSFFDNTDDFINNVITIVLLLMCTAFPVWGHLSLRKNYKRLSEDSVSTWFEVLVDGVRTKSLS